MKILYSEKSAVCNRHEGSLIVYADREDGTCPLCFLEVVLSGVKEKMGESERKVKSQHEEILSLKKGGIDVHQVLDIKYEDYEASDPKFYKNIKK